MVHPFQTDMLDEIVHYLLLLAASDSEDASGFRIDYIDNIPLTVVKLEFILNLPEN